MITHVARFGVLVSLLVIQPASAQETTNPGDAAERPGSASRLRKVFIRLEKGDSATLLLDVDDQGGRTPRPQQLRVAGRDVRLAEEKGPQGQPLLAIKGGVNLQQLRRNQDRLAQLTNNTMRVPVFEGRELVRTIQVPKVDFAQLAPDALVELPTAVPVDETLFERSLLIRDPLVVRDLTRARTGGKWTFEYLMRQMANTPETGVMAEDFVLAWLRTWEAEQTANGFPVPPRAGVKDQITDPWLAKSEAAGGPPGKLNLSLAPFRLLAIVNRVDLKRANGPTDGGEARFVFAAADDSSSLLFTVIFEYGIIKVDNDELQAWGKQWYDLKDKTLGTEDYNAALEAITEQFAKAAVNPAAANGSALRQLRTNDFLQSVSGGASVPWQLREFVISADSHLLELTTVKQTPDISINRTAALAQYINTQVARNLEDGDKHRVPEKFPAGQRFLGASSEVQTAPADPADPDKLRGFFWEGPDPVSDVHRVARHNFSLNTCSGCHSGETMRDGRGFNPAEHFTHIRPTLVDGEGRAVLSLFLIGIPDPANPGKHLPFVRPDPGEPTTDRSFFDLGRRAQRLEELVSLPAALEEFRRPLRAVH